MTDIRTKLELVYGRMRRKIVPRLRGSQDMYESSLKELVRPDIAWLDVGCGHQILAEWRSEAEKDLLPDGGIIVGLDCDLPSLKNHRSISLLVQGDMVQLPFADGSFDLVTANMVVEHLTDPMRQFAEVARILRPGGSFLFHTPNAHGYFSLIRRLFPDSFAGRVVKVLDGRELADVFPVKYRANTLRQIEKLARSTSLELEKTKFVVSEAVTQLIAPLALFELLWIRILMSKRLKPFRTNIIVLLTKRGVPS